MKDRFNLEEEISQLYNFAEQLGSLSEGILEHNLTNDETVNALEGLKVLLSVHANKLSDTMSQCFKLDGYKESLIETEDYL
jgi:hypothetical protein